MLIRSLRTVECWHEAAGAAGQVEWLQCASVMHVGCLTFCNWGWRNIIHPRMHLALLHTQVSSSHSRCRPGTIYPAHSPLLHVLQPEAEIAQEKNNQQSGIKPQHYAWCGTIRQASHLLRYDVSRSCTNSSATPRNDPGHTFSFNTDTTLKSPPQYECRTASGSLSSTLPNPKTNLRPQTVPLDTYLSKQRESLTIK